MTMHLLGPMYTTTGKPKGKRKWQSAEQKRLAEQRQADWGIMLRKLDDLKPNFSNKPVKSKKPGELTISVRTPPGRETPHIESKDTGWIPCVKVKDNTYTGDKIKGIGTLHKSNGVPIFTDEEAKDIAKMRR